MNKVYELLFFIGSFVCSWVRSVGQYTLFILNVFVQVFRPPFRLNLIIKQIYYIGFRSLSVIVLVGVFTGAVLAVQAEYTLAKFGATAFAGSAIALSLLRELGPVLTALMVNGRAGSAVTAELGIMKISEQVDALRSMSLDPVKFLIMPRIVAGIICVPLLTAIFNTVGILGGYVVGVGTLGLSSGMFWSQIYQAVEEIDVISGMVKAFFFGLGIFWIACFKGWNCGFGAVGVNKATTDAVVASSVYILVVNYFLSSILTQVLP